MRTVACKDQGGAGEESEVAWRISRACSLTPSFPSILPLVRKTTLYIDIDDTIIAEVLPGSGRDLRPWVITHLTVLGQLFDCCWLTSWPYSPADTPRNGMCVQTLMHALYAYRINEIFRYANWEREHPTARQDLSSTPSSPKTGTGSKIRFPLVNSERSPQPVNSTATSRSTRTVPGASLMPSTSSFSGRESRALHSTESEPVPSGSIAPLYLRDRFRQSHVTKNS